MKRLALLVPLALLACSKNEKDAAPAPSAASAPSASAAPAQAAPKAAAYFVLEHDAPVVLADGAFRAVEPRDGKVRRSYGVVAGRELRAWAYGNEKAWSLAGPDAQRAFAGAAELTLGGDDAKGLVWGSDRKTPLVFDGKAWTPVPGVSGKNVRVHVAPDGAVFATTTEAAFARSGDDWSKTDIPARSHVAGTAPGALFLASAEKAKEGLYRFAAGKLDLVIGNYGSAVAAASADDVYASTTEGVVHVVGGKATKIAETPSAGASALLADGTLAVAIEGGTRLAFVRGDKVVRREPKNEPLPYPIDAVTVDSAGRVWATASRAFYVATADALDIYPTGALGAFTSYVRGVVVTGEGPKLPPAPPALKSVSGAVKIGGKLASGATVYLVRRTHGDDRCDESTAARWRKTTADKDGRFAFQNVPRAPFCFSAEYEGKSYVPAFLSVGWNPSGAADTLEVGTLEEK